MVDLVTYIILYHCSRISDTIENHVDKPLNKLVRVELRTDATKDGAYTEFPILRTVDITQSCFLFAYYISIKQSFF